MAGIEVRVATVKLILQLESGGSLTRLLPDAQQKLAEGDRALLQAFCFGMARWSGQLSGIVDGLLAKPLKAKDNDIYLLMQLGVFQLLHTRVAPHAAVNSTVSVVKSLGKPWAKGLVNAVLRNFQRQSESLVSALDEPASLSHPQWLLTHFKKDWPALWQQIVEQGNRQAPMILRVNQLQNSTSEYLDTLKAANIAASPVPELDSAIMLDSPVPVFALPGFELGSVSVQDGAAQIAASLLCDESVGDGSVRSSRKMVAGKRLLDACAAPGGKSAHALERGAWSEVVALDSDAERLKRVEQTVDRLNVSERCTLVCADASDTQSWWDGKFFDAVLIDAPCSATGVIRRHPDIKLLRRADDIEALVETQRAILSSLWQVLAPGGKLIYATCSILKDENERQIEWFLQQHQDAAEHPIAISFGEKRSAGSVQLLPGEKGFDGFFYSVLIKHGAASQVEPLRVD